MNAQVVEGLVKALKGVLHHNSAVKSEYQLPNSLIQQINKALADAGR